MFESATERVYFQNFNKLSAEHLWYRVSEGPWKHLQSPTVTAWLALTNPADRIAYLIPVSAIQQRIKQTGWSRDYLEININPVSSRWTELDWKIEQFLLEL